MVYRLINLQKLLTKNQSTFLFGPRGVGKTTLVEAYLKNVSHGISINLLHDDVFNYYLKDPSLLRGELLKSMKTNKSVTVLIDEIQRLPALLNEIHDLLVKHKAQLQFILTGSSARKLKRNAANLLAGRAWELKLHPLTHLEVDWDLDRVLSTGSLPQIYLEDSHPERTLKSYVNTYLKEEIQQETQIRNLQGFVRFLEIAAQMNGEPVNFTKIGKESGITVKTCQEYFSVLVDTLIAFRIDGWSHSIRKQVQVAPKFYFFDCGVLNSIRGDLGHIPRPGSFLYGKLFEMMTILEIIRLNDYFEKDFKFFYWRTNTGMEVDLVIQKGMKPPLFAVEIKSCKTPTTSDVHGLKSFLSENPSAKPMILCQAKRAYDLEGVSIMPWKEGISEIFK